jgi:hypothetical protein
MSYRGIIFKTTGATEAVSGRQFRSFLNECQTREEIEWNIRVY